MVTDLYLNLKGARERLCLAQIACETDHPTPLAARKQIQEAIDAIDKVKDLDKPSLGLATTGELIRELASRADVAEMVGEEWPNYRTATPSREVAGEPAS